eukprot:TRINITY_DN3536_c0_g1_i1.p2 TRINITY_DN3536_c0_g1~~TRINITY_DN3536_c0_g1_i1.p2  ORF type:complete len:135 (-),score=17.88 TRINITY_DN3536_c0_g1_i1:334-738(-)
MVKYNSCILLILAVLGVVSITTGANNAIPYIKGRKRKHKGAGKDDKPKHDHHRRHSCEKAYFTFHTKDMDCEEAKTRVEKVISKSSHKSQCMANASVEVLQGCDAPRTKDYRVSRVVLLCDTATNTVCADATNG